MIRKIWVLSLSLACMFAAFEVGAQEGHVGSHAMGHSAASAEAHTQHAVSDHAMVQPTVSASIDFSGVLVQGSDHALSLRLTDKKGMPVTLEHLQEVHKSKIHLFIVDETLQDYKHVHPTPTSEPGAYSFFFRPLTPHNYKVWVDIRPVDGGGEMLPVVLTGSAPCAAPCVVKNETLSATVDELQFTVDLKGEALRVGGTYHPEITIKGATGQDVVDLQPIMGAYAHIVGFYDDFSSLAHMHPMGEEPATDDLRGKSPLSFMLSPAREGFLKMFIQIKRDDKEIFAPVGAVVQAAP